MKSIVYLLPLFFFGLASCGVSTPDQQQASSPSSSHSGSVPDQAADQKRKGMPLDAAIAERFVKVNDYVEDKYPTTKSCNIDLITDASTGHMESSIPSGHSIGFAGWGADNDRQVAPSSVFVILKGGDIFATVGTMGGVGESAATDDAMKKFQFNIAASTVGVPKGPYKVALVLDFGHAQQLCPLWKDISVD